MLSLSLKKKSLASWIANLTLILIFVGLRLLLEKYAFGQQDGNIARYIYFIVIFIFALTTAVFDSKPWSNGNSYLDFFAFASVGYALPEFFI